jgi:hypothetical protein
MNHSSRDLSPTPSVSVEEFHALLRGQGVPMEHIAFKCPMCDTIQSPFDLIKAGAGSDFSGVEYALGYCCVGRWTHRKGPPSVPGSQVGCDWTLGGLLRTHKLNVVDADGLSHPRFEVCTPEEAVTHMNQNLAT